MGEGPSIRDELAAANEHYQGVGEGPDGPPPGLYKFQLVSAELRRSNTGKLLIIWTHVVLEGEHKGEQMVDFSQPASEKPFPIRMMRQRIARLGWDAPENLPDLEELIPEIEAAGPIYTGRVKHRGSFANLIVEQVINQYGARGGQARPAQQSVAPQIAAAFAVGDEVSFACDDGVTLRGVVESIDGDQASVRVEGEKDLFVGGAADLTLVAPTAATGSGDDELIAFADALGFETAGEDVESVVLALRGEALEAANLTDDEAALMSRYDVPVKPKPKAVVKKAAKKAVKKAAKKAAKKKARK